VPLHDVSDAAWYVLFPLSPDFFSLFPKTQANVCGVCSAAPFQWAAIFHKTDINFTHGHHSLEWYDP
jgi:hypothetical protein